MRGARINVQQITSILTLIIAIALIVFDFRPRAALAPAMPKCHRRVSALFIITTVLLAISGVLPLAVGRPMHGWMLMLHMTTAPLFALSAAMLALLWANATRWSIEAWLAMVGAFVNISSAMLGMMSWFGSDAQRWLLDVHRVSGLIVVIAAAAQARVVFKSGQHAARTGD
jgi:hypothetical protein